MSEIPLRYLHNPEKNKTISVDITRILSVEIGPPLLKEIEESCNSLQLSEDDLLTCYRVLYCDVLALDNRTDELCYQPYDNSIPDHILSDHPEAEAHPTYRYSSFSCMGGSQRINVKMLRSLNTRKQFPIGDSAFKVCKFHNVCLLYGDYPSLIYFEDPASANLADDFQLKYFGVDDHLHLGYFSDYYSSKVNKPFMHISFINESIPEDLFLHSDTQRVAMLVAHSWNNFGHHLYDVIISMFTAALLYNIPVERVQPVFETKCKKFNIASGNGLEPLCLKYMEKFATILSENFPIFLDDLLKFKRRVCFRTMVAGFGSAFSQRALDLSKDLVLRKFRNHVINYLSNRGDFNDPFNYSGNKNRISVLLRGAIGGSVDILNDILCNTTKRAIQMSPLLAEKYIVHCFQPGNVSFADEVFMAQNSKLIISYHGTQAYTLLFASEGTQAILMTENIVEEYGKDFQIFSRLAYVNVFWLLRDRWEREISELIYHAIRLQNF